MSFCFAWLITELGQIILMRFISLRDMSLVCCTALAKQTKISRGRGRINLPVWGNLRRFCVWGNIFCLSSIGPSNWGVNHSDWFCTANKWQREWCSCSHCRPRKRVQQYYTFHACSLSESQQKPVISHVNACLKANMKINCGTYNNNTWEMEQSLFLQSSQPRRGCLSLWEDVWLPPLYVCFQPLSWFSYTSTFSSKHVKIFHAH